MATARELIADAFQLSGVVGIGENIEGAELDAGLKRLNAIIAEWQTKEVMCYTKNRIATSTNFDKIELSIGDYNANKINTIIDDGFITTTNLKKQAIDLIDTTIAFSGLEDYTEDRLVLSVLDDIVITAPQETPANAINVATCGIQGGAVTLDVDDATGFSIGDNIIATNKDDYSVSGEITDIIGNGIVLDDGYYTLYGDGVGFIGGSVFLYADRVTKPKATKGYIYDTSLEVADIIEQRPNYLNRMFRNQGTSSYVINIIDNGNWNYNSETTGSAPNQATYYTDYPFGLLRFDAKVNDGLTIEYFKLLDNVDLDDEIDLPPAYYSAYEYNLAVSICQFYGKNPMGIKQQANNLRMALIRQNATITPIQAISGRGGYNIQTNRFDL